MPYVRRNWQNAPSSATPLNAAALNNIETGIEEALAKPGATDAAVEAIIADTGSDTYATLNSTIVSIANRAKTIVLFGDSRTDDSDFNTSPNTYSTNMSWFDWGNAARTGGPALIPIYKGVSGNTTAQMLARFDADVLALNPGAVTIWGGTNDSWASYANVDTSYGRIAQMVASATAKGIRVILISETTAANGSFGKTTDFPKYAAYYNDRLRSLAEATPGVEFWDFNGVLTDPASGTGQPRAGVLRDGLHLSPYGASLVGVQVVGPALSKVRGDLVALVSSQIDSRAVSASSANILVNGLMVGSAGTVGSGHTGSMPDNWSSSGNVVAVSTPARADGVGDDIRMVLTATSTSNVFITRQLQNSHLLNGKSYVVEAELNVVQAEGIGSTSLTVVATVGGITYRFGWGYETETGYTAGMPADQIAPGKYIVRSNAFLIPAGSVTSVNFQWRTFVRAASAVADMRLGRVAVREVQAV